MGEARQKIAVGVIGAGGMGGRHARNLHQRIVGVEVAAIMDADAARAQTVAQACGGAQVFSDAHQLIQDPRVQAVLIASPDRTHAGFVLECLRQNKPVLCEKPLATTVADAQKIIEAETQGGRKLVQVGFMRHYDPQHVAVKQAVERGEIGRPVLLKGWHRNINGDPGSTSAEIVTNSAIHDLDSARWLLGQEVEEVYVQGVSIDKSLGDNVWDVQLLHLRLSGNCLATIEVHVSVKYGYDVGVEIVGDSGAVQTGSNAPAVVRKQRTASQPVDFDWLERFDTAYMVELQHWIDSLKATGAPSGPNAWDGYASLVVAEACIESIHAGKPQAVKPVTRPALYQQ